MIFGNVVFLPIILIVIVLFVLYVFLYEKKYFIWVKKFWFLKQSTKSKISCISYLIAFVLLFLSLLDVRGPAEKINAPEFQDRVLILIDVSSSMLAQDVRPSRIERAIIIARHFLASSPAKQFALAIFSDMQKLLVPFTTDKEFVDAKISGISSVDMNSASSNIVSAILESLSEFKTSTGHSKGNILVLTDGEEQGISVKLDFPEALSLSVVGIGTEQGATIPVQNKLGTRQQDLGKKYYKGQEVITHLDESFIKNLASLAPRYKYWIAGSYSLPTTEIISFMSAQDSNESENSIHDVRPVWSLNLILLAFVFFILAFLLRRFKTFSYVMLLFFSYEYSLYAQTDNLSEETMDTQSLEQQIEAERLSREVNEDYARLKTEKLNRSERLKLAEKLLKLKRNDEALKLYEENLTTQDLNDNETLRFNYATSLLENEKYQEAAREFLSLKNDLSKENKEENVETIKKLNENLSRLLKQANVQSSQKESGESEDSQENETDKSNSEQNSSKGNQKDNKNKDQGNSKNNEKTDEEKNNQDQDNEMNNENEEKKNTNEASTDQNNDVDKKKVEGILKQLLEDDRRLQNEKMDTKTNDVQKNSQRKDW